MGISNVLPASEIELPKPGCVCSVTDSIPAKSIRHDLSYVILHVGGWRSVRDAKTRLVVDNLGAGVACLRWRRVGQVRPLIGSSARAQPSFAFQPPRQPQIPARCADRAHSVWARSAPAPRTARNFLPRRSLRFENRHGSHRLHTGRSPMKCFTCGEDMRLALVEPHDEVTMRGFEYRTFRCECCGDTERRFVFDPRASLDLSSIGRS
jgi:hypothetical protein